MGLGDRDYMRNDYSGGRKRPRRRTRGRSVAVTIIVINIALWVANGLLSAWSDGVGFFADDGLTASLLLKQDLLPHHESEQTHFFQLNSCYRFLTYGFVHDTGGWMHVVFNMIALLMFGYGMMLGIGPGGFGLVRGENVEERLGRLEFTAFYCLTLIVGGLVFALTNIAEPRAGVLGASGGVSGVVILFAWLYPRKTLLFWGILPIPMWALGGLLVVMDAMGAAGNWGGGIAYSVHLAGAACGTLYYFAFLKQRRTLTGWLNTARSPRQRKPKLRIHVPEEPLPTTEDAFSRRLDEILKHYGEVGEAGLSAEEREFLQQASRKFAEKRRKR